MNSKWSNNDIITFLELYEKYDVLWNIESEKYRNRNTRNECMSKLLQELHRKGINLDVDEVRKKIKTIKTVYCQELSKIEKSRLNGGNVVYAPKLVWFGTADRFLRNVTTTRNSFSKMDIFQPLNKSENSDDNDDHDAQEKFHIFQPLDKTENSDENEEYITKQAKKPKLSKITERKSKKFNKTKTKSKIFSADNASDDDSSYRPKPNSSKTEDELDYFGKYVTASLRQLPPINAILCQEEIQNILGKERIAVMTQKSTESRRSPEIDPLMHLQTDSNIDSMIKFSPNHSSSDSQSASEHNDTSKTISIAYRGVNSAFISE